MTEEEKQLMKTTSELVNVAVNQHNIIFMAWGTKNKNKWPTIHGLQTWELPTTEPTAAKTGLYDTQQTKDWWANYNWRWTKVQDLLIGKLDVTTTMDNGQPMEKTLMNVCYILGFWFSGWSQLGGCMTTMKPGSIQGKANNVKQTANKQPVHTVSNCLGLSTTFNHTSHHGY